MSADGASSNGVAQTAHADVVAVGVSAVEAPPAPLATAPANEPTVANAPQQSAPQAATLPAPALSGQAKAHTATVAQPQKAPAFAKPADGPGIGGAVFALILVVSLILGLGWLARRMPGVGRASNNALRVVGSLALGPRDRVVVVEAGATQLLLGVSSSGIRHLHTLDAPLPVAQPSQGQSIATPFAQLLAQHFGKKP